MMWWYGAPRSGMFSYGSWWAFHMIAVILFWVFFVALAVIAAKRFIRPRRAENEYLSQGGILSAVTI
jgi:hypothetical protein